MIGCHDARNAVIVREVHCPHCGEIMECFERDGIHAVDAYCENCDFTIPAGIPFKEKPCD